MTFKSIALATTVLVGMPLVTHAAPPVSGTALPVTNKSGLYADKTTAYRESDLFDRIDIDNDGVMTAPELMDYHASIVVEKTLDEFEYVEEATRGELAQAFKKLDTNNDDKLTRAEFVGISEAIEIAANPPVAYTMTYWIKLSGIDANDLEGRRVENLKGDEIGTVENIIRRKSDGQLYVMIDLDGRPMYQPGKMEPDIVGLKMNDILFVEDTDAFALTTKAENEIRDLKTIQIDQDDMEEVDQLMTASF